VDQGETREVILSQLEEGEQPGTVAVGLQVAVAEEQRAFVMFGQLLEVPVSRLLGLFNLVS
jgi:hypothetical protein